ncbi:Arylsulfatase [Caulifigura coniformis]|uniref:Arylsulfatase n=1 Tax=Caulifigura coniformis TaxID=2527983 RepID=A0A517SAZ5_9PLAN|nr:sulfatase-like hydrolase/transferase [Caulifigura coniformis]QDT53297.1 Arylsulfatase [Caulifigura coniformis]
MRIAALLVLSALSTTATAAEKPNILFLFADDMTYAAIRELGNPEIQTPNLDRLARQGTCFTHASNMGGYHGAVCVASRTMLVTGRSVWRARELDHQMKQKEEVGALWPERMHAAGYETYHSGKWHVSTDPAKRFDHLGHYRPGGMPATVPESYNRPLAGKPDPWSPSDPKHKGFWEGGKHWSEVVADDAIGFLDDAATRGKPFFMYIAFNAPHDPRQSPQSFVDRYPASQIQVPKSFLPEYPWKDQIGCDPKLRDEALGPFPRTEHAVQVHRQEYYAIITHLDEQIGRILDHLEKSGKAANTYVFFTADHGLAVGHHGLMGKQNLFDHSVRVPFLARGEKFQAGGRVATPIYLQDVMPTSLELAGAEIPESVEFKSLLPLAEGQPSPHHGDAIYGAYTMTQRSVTKDGFKLVVYPNVPKLLLFDLKADPDEIHDLSGETVHQGRVATMFQDLQMLQKRLSDPLVLQASAYGLP